MKTHLPSTLLHNSRGGITKLVIFSNVRLQITRARFAERCYVQTVEYTVAY